MNRGKLKQIKKYQDAIIYSFNIPEIYILQLYIFLMFRLTKKLFFNIGQIEAALTEKLTQTFKPYKLSITNQSHLHSRGTETHFNVLIVSEQFKDLAKVKQHQLVYASLGELMAKIHALTITCYAEQPVDAKAWSLGCFHGKPK